MHKMNSTSELFNIWTCSKCPDGCETCPNNEPCLVDVDIKYKRAALAFNIVCIFICFVLLALTWYHNTLNILKTSSPNMLFIVLLGSIIYYCEVNYFLIANSNLEGLIF